jgi:tRNA nucleotidyltransferase/poly(A) polymerase
MEIGILLSKLLRDLNKINHTLLYGGYLRDLYLKIAPTDADIITNISKKELRVLFPEAVQRRTINGFDVLGMKIEKDGEKLFVEISSTDEDLFEKVKRADYTINALCHDGEKLHDLMGSVDDMQAKIIKAADIRIIQKDFKERPVLWIKTLRLLAVTGFTLSDCVFEELLNYKHVFFEIDIKILRMESYRIINGKYPLNAIKVLSKLGCLSVFEADSFAFETSKKMPYGPHFRLCLLAVIINKQTMDEFMDFLKFVPKSRMDYEKLYAAYHSGEKVKDTNLKNRVIVLKKEIEQLRNRGK